MSSFAKAHTHTHSARLRLGRTTWLDTGLCSGWSSWRAQPAPLSVYRFVAFLGFLGPLQLNYRADFAGWQSLTILQELKSPPARGHFASLIPWAACALIEACGTVVEDHASTLMDPCLAFIDAAIARNTEECQHAALRAVQSLSSAMGEQRPLVKR